MTDDVDETLILIRQAVSDYIRPDAQRTRAARDAAFGCDESVWRGMAEQGWLAALPPEEAGGMGLGVGAAAIIAERLGYACRGEPFVGVAVMAVLCLAGCPPGDLRDALLRGILDGSRLCSLAWQAAGGDLAADRPGVRAAPDQGSVRLEGEARFVAAPQADTFIVSAQTSEGLALYAVPADAPGLQVKRETATDGTQSGHLTLRGLAVPASAELGRGDLAATALGGALNAGVLCTAAELLGLIERMLEITVDYIGVRKQFGQAIGSFQVIQHRTVDMWMQKELTRASLHAALKEFGGQGAARGALEAAASSAKARASQAALYVAGQAVQLHGAIGYTDEYELGVYVNRSVALAAHLGSAAVHRRRYGERIAVVER